MIFEVITLADNDEYMLSNWFEAYKQCFEIDYNNDTYEGFLYYATLKNEEVNAKYYSIIENNKVVSGALIFIMEKAIWVLYLFTLPDYRGKGYAKAVMNAINIDYPGDQYMYIVELEKKQKYDNIRKWWVKRGYRKIAFCYYVPKMNDDLGIEIGVLSINELFYRTKNHNFNTRYLIKIIEIYFKYGFCFRDVEVKGFEAFKLNKEQLLNYSQ